MKLINSWELNREMGGNYLATPQKIARCPDLHMIFGGNPGLDEGYSPNAPDVFASFAARPPSRDIPSASGTAGPATRPSPGEYTLCQHRSF